MLSVISLAAAYNNKSIRLSVIMLSAIMANVFAPFIHCCLSIFQTCQFYSLSKFFSNKFNKYNHFKTFGINIIHLKIFIISHLPSRLAKLWPLELTTPFSFPFQTETDATPNHPECHSHHQPSTINHQPLTINQLLRSPQEVLCLARIIASTLGIFSIAAISRSLSSEKAETPMPGPLWQWRLIAPTLPWSLGPENSGLRPFYHYFTTSAPQHYQTPSDHKAFPPLHPEDQPGSKYLSLSSVYTTPDPAQNQDSHESGYITSPLPADATALPYNANSTHTPPLDPLLDNRPPHR